MRGWPRFLSSVLVLLAARLAFAQTTAGAPTAAPDYSKEAAVVESYRAAVAFNNDGTGTRDLSERVRVQSEAGVQQWDLLVFPYASPSEQVSIDYVRVRHPDGTVVATPPESVQDVSSAITRQCQD